MPDAQKGGSSIVARNARAVWLGVLAALTALAPARCGGCRSVIGRDDAFCVLCGRQLLTTKAQN